MPRYVKAEAFTGDWNNNGRGRVVKCPTCGSQFRAYMPIKTARCPRNHVMKVLTGHGSETPRSETPPYGEITV